MIIITSKNFYAKVQDFVKKNELTYNNNLLKLDDDIIVNIENININDKDTRILVLGKLLNIANENDIKLGYDNENTDILEYEEY